MRSLRPEYLAESLVRRDRWLTVTMVAAVGRAGALLLCVSHTPPFLGVPFLMIEYRGRLAPSCSISHLTSTVLPGKESLSLEIALSKHVEKA